VHNNLNEQSRAMLKLCGEEVVPEFKDKVDTLVVLDTGSRLTVEPFLRLAEQRILIDHHEPNKDYLSLFTEHHVDEKTVSCSEIVYDLLEAAGFRMDRKVAVCLAAGVVTDSANYVAARPATFINLGNILQKHRIDYNEVLNLVSLPMDVSERIARLKGGQRARIERHGGAIIAVTNVSSFEGSVANSLLNAGADVSFVGMSGKGEVRIAGRCKRWLSEKGLNLGRDIMPEAAKIIAGDGGGHAGAAGATGRDPDKLDAALEKCVSLVKKALGEIKA
jgi:nanoRNase/pAp phosphatase (c-di-AMP/oligoRNAs hydrolase)